MAVPLGALALCVAPLLWLGVPWPALDDFARTEALGTALSGRLYLLAPALTFGLFSCWALMAGGFAVAWEQFGERKEPVMEGVLDAPAA
jgi:hypothetical protein